MKPKEKNLRVELGYLRDNLIEGITQGKTALVKDGLEMYEALVSTFIDKLKEYGSTYDKKRAMQEFAAFEEGWSEIEWIKDDLREIIDTSLSTQNINVIRKVLYFPVHLGSLAYIEGDYYIFHQFINWVPYCYGLSLRLEDSQLREFVVDRCWRFLKEMADLIITPDIERSSTEEEIEKKNEFAVGIILVFNQLLKRAYNEKRIDDFKAFLRSLSLIFEQDETHMMEDEADDIQWHLENQQLTSEEKSSLGKKLGFLKKHIWAVKEMKQKKSLVLYGLNAWILHHYDAGRLEIDEIKQWHESFPSFGDLKENWEIFLKAKEREIEHELSWDWWGLDEHPEGEVVSIGFDGYLQLLCCVRCLEIIKLMNPAQREQAAIPHTPDILYLAEREDSPFMQILKGIEQHREKWKPVIGDDALAAIPIFREMLKKAVDAQKEEDIRVLIEASLWDERIEEVKMNILKEWRNNAGVRHIVQNYGNYEYIPTSPEGKDFYGFNTIDLKEIYVKESRISAHRWGEQYGRGLATGENKNVLAKIVSSLPLHVAEPVFDEKIVKAVDEALGKLEASDYDPIILILKSWSASRIIATADGFDSADSIGGKTGVLGYYKKKPVFRLHYWERPMITVVDVKKLGIWRQFKPKQVLEEEQYISVEGCDVFSFCVKPLTKESALELIQKQPRFRRDKDGHEKPEEEVLTELQQRVHFRIVEQFEFEVSDKNSGYKIPVTR